MLPLFIYNFDVHCCTYASSNAFRISLFWAVSIQFAEIRFRSLVHRVTGFFILRVLDLGPRYNTFFVHLSSVVLATCPAHRHFSLATLYPKYSFQTLIIILSTNLSISHCVICRFFMDVLVSVKICAPYL